MTVHVCGSEGESIGQYEEQEFRNNLFAGRFPRESYYWHEGMADWAPIASYKALAKTQKISFAPPMARTVKMNIETAPAAPPKPESSVKRLWRRLTGGL